MSAPSWRGSEEIGESVRQNFVPNTAHDDDYVVGRLNQDEKLFTLCACQKNMPALIFKESG